MKVLLTGGSGDLGQTLVPRLLADGHIPVILDIREPTNLPAGAIFSRGSILDRVQLPDYLSGSDCIVHIAGWHGIHESNGEKNAHDLFDLNVRGTFEVFEAATSLGIDKIVHISTTSVHRPNTLYARSKILGERIAEDYGAGKAMNVMILRPRGFIPYWNRSVYTKFREWAQWFWRGAVHIDDVASAVMQSIDLLSRQRLDWVPVLTLDSAYEYTEDDLKNWDANGAGSTFRKYYAEFYDLAISYGLDPTAKPNRLDISEAVRWLGYKPTYSLANILSELAAHGDRGPPHT
jgi:nucleoside-diphosphate-sugar epimerase